MRPQTPADDVAAVHAAAFARADGGEVAEANLVGELHRDGDLIPALCLVAEVDGAVAGSVVCSRADLGGRPVVALGPLGVLPASQRHGIGSALVRAVLDAADALGEPAVVLLGHTGFYPRFGFRPGADLGVVPPVAEWGPHFMVRPLSAWAGTGGQFRYAPAFDRL